MKKIYIFGMGKGKAFVDRCLLKDQAKCIGYVNNFRKDTERIYNNIPIVKQDELEDDYDYMVITLMQYRDTKKDLIRQGIEPEKIICFFDFLDAGNEAYWNILDSYKWRMELMWGHYTGTVMPALENLDYEIYAETEDVRDQCPKIMDVDRTAELLLKDKKCMARFGDNEFELMCGRVRTNYQDVNMKLGERLKEVLHSQDDNLLVAIANDYGNLGQYTDMAAQAIRSYISRAVRQQHMELLDIDREYGDAYISRPYIIYRNKKKAGERFENIKKIWNEQDVLIVEGEYTRFGVGNDLLDNAASVARVIAPSQNAFSQYDEIIAKVREQGRNKLILVILGPTATVMAYDLSKEGYWIIDIGQLDVEYEWYLRNVKERCNIPYKCVSEVMQYGEIVTDDTEDYIKKYKAEIVAAIL